MQIIQLKQRSTISIDTNLNGGKIENRNAEDIVINTLPSDNFRFPVEPSDTLFVLARNRSYYKEGISNLISKMITIKEFKYINLDIYSDILPAFGLEELTIFSINFEGRFTIDSIKSEKGAKILYFNMDHKMFMKFINSDDRFLEYNKNSLYILRGGSYLDIKNIFSLVSGHKVNVCRGGSQKAHILSPLDLRLSVYMMAMFGYKLLNYLNTFHDLSKDRYLSYTNYYSKSSKNLTLNKDFNEFKPLTVSEMPLFYDNLDKSFWICSDILCDKALNKNL